MRLTIGKKQALIVIILFLFIITIGGTAFISIRTVSENLNFLTSRIYQMERVLKMRFFLTRTKDHYISIKNSQNTREIYAAKLQFSDYLRFSEELLQGLSNREDIQISKKFAELTRWVKLKNEEFAKNARNKNWDLITTSFAVYENKIEQILQILDFFMNNIDQDVKLTINENKSYIYKTNIIILAILFISILFGTLFAVYLTQTIVKSIGQVVRFAESIANNDLTCVIGENYIVKKDETGDMAKAIQIMKNNLSDILQLLKNRSDDIVENIGELAFSINNTLATVQQFSVIVKEINDGSVNQKNFVQGVMTATEQISRSIESVTKNVHHQTTAFEEFSAAIEEMTASINNIAAITDHSKDVSDKLTQAAEEGSTLITDVLRSVNLIESSSYKIRGIVDVIRDVAEQTNLLAMNAAIEAAHAGEYGKGFAVVAEEIRKLADNSMNSSKEIHTLLKNIMQVVKQTVELGKLANFGLDKIVGEIKDTANINDEIYSSTQEQSKGAKEIILSIHDLLSLAQENSSAITEINNGSKSITEAMIKLSEISVQFTLAAENHYSGSEDILKYLAEEKFSIDKISRVLDEFHRLIQNFKLNSVDNKNSMKPLTFTDTSIS